MALAIKMLKVVPPDNAKSYDEAKSKLHEFGVNDLCENSTHTKLFPVADENGELRWAVLVEHLITS